MNPSSIAILLFLILGPFSMRAQGPAYIPGDVLVMLAKDADAHRVASDLAFVDGRSTAMQVVREVSAPMRAWLYHFDESTFDQGTVLRAFQRHPGVQLAQNNHVIKERAVPNDAQYGQQWHHQNIDSEAAWDISTGGVTATGDTIVVCIIEDADLPHADLIANAWYNRAEIAGNGIDDDGNGYVDDVRGWNTPGNNDDVYGGSHGTQVAGMIGAKGNNGLGVAGANWNVKMMVVDYGGVQEAQVVAAYTYPLVMRRMYNASNGTAGAFVVATNASWGIDGGDPSDSPIWCAMYDTLGTAGILNCGATANNNVNVDVVGDLPTACPSDFLVSVTATNNSDVRTFSGYGLTTIDVGAPGESVRTTSLGGGYGNTSGTSFASPLTAGVIGLLYSAPCATMMGLVHADPAAGALYVRDMLFDGVEQVGNLGGQTVTGGRISAGNSMQAIMNACGTCPAPFGATVALSGNEASYAWTSLSEGPFNVRYRVLGQPDWTEVMDVPTASFVVGSIDPCATYEFQVEVMCEGETSGYSPSTLLIPPVEAPPVISLSGYPVACEDAPVTLTSSASGVNTWSNGSSGQSITVNSSGSYSVTLTGICGTYVSEPVEILVLSPTDPVANNVALPGPGTATLTATGDQVLWYAAASGGTPVGSGSPWETPFLNSTTSFWCTSSISNEVQSVFGGRLNNSASGQYHTNADNWQVFEAYEPFTIRSVKVYANGAGNRTFALVNMPGGSTVAQLVANVPDGESRVDLDFAVPGPGQYGLRIAGGNPQLWRDGLGSNPGYPFPLGTMGSVTSSTVGGANATAYYYFFYDWEVEPQQITCESDRVEVVVEMAVGIGTNGDRLAVSVFPQPADHQLIVDLVAAREGRAARMSVSDATGRIVLERSLITDRTVIDTDRLTDGLYSYRIVLENGRVALGKFLVTHAR
ncbi:MAG: S8 family serine peptidase [Flavobacteriales bacterium]